MLFTGYPGEQRLSTADISRMTSIWRDAVSSYLEKAKLIPDEWHLFRQRELTFDDLFPRARMDWDFSAQDSKVRKQGLRRLLEVVFADNILMEKLTDWGKNMVSIPPNIKNCALKIPYAVFPPGSNCMGISIAASKGLSST